MHGSVHTSFPIAFLKPPSLLLPFFSFFAPVLLLSSPILSFVFIFVSTRTASVSSQWFNGRKRNYLCRHAADRRDRVALGFTQKERETEGETRDFGRMENTIDRMVRERLSTRVYKRGRAAIWAYNGIHCQLVGCLQSIDYYHSNRPVTTRRDTAPGQWTNTKTRVDPPTFAAILRKINTSRRISAKLSSTSTGNCSIVLWLDPREDARRDGFRAIQTKVDTRDVMLYAASNLGALERFLRRMYLVLRSFFILWFLEVAVLCRVSTCSNCRISLWDIARYFSGSFLVERSELLLRIICRSLLLYLNLFEGVFLFIRVIFRRLLGWKVGG